MKKLLIISCLLLLTLTGCTQQNQNNLKVGVITGQQTEIIEYLQQLAKAADFNFEIIPFKDYIEINTALKQGKIDLNCFQNQIYLDQVNKERQTDFVPVGKTFLAPLAIYSKTLTNLTDLKPNSKIAIPDDLLTTARALRLLEQQNLLQLKEITGKLYNLSDIAKNPLALELIAIDSSQIREALPTHDLVLLPLNYALSISLSPTTALAREEISSPFVQLIVARQDNKNDPRIAQFIKLYNSAQTKNFIEQTYQGNLIPAW